MTQPDVTDHGRLLTLAAKAQGAASDGDVEQLERHLRSFVHTFAGHLREFSIVRPRLGPVDAARLRRGHVAVAASARVLLRQAVAGCPELPGSCSRLAETLRALLTLQGRDERLVLETVPALVETEAPSRAVRW